MLFDRIEKGLTLVSLGLALVSAAMILSMPLFISYSTIMRYIAGSPLSVTEELASFMLVSCIFLALPYAALKGKHIAIHAVSANLKGRVKEAVGVVTNLMSFLFLVLLTKLTFDFAMQGYLLNSHSETAYIYEAPWRAVMPVSSAWLSVIALFFCLRHVAALFRGKTTHEIRGS